MARLTLHSQIALGIRRNFSNIAAADFGATVLHSVSHQTVCRCEVRAASAFIASFNVYVAELLDKTFAADASDTSDAWTLMGVSLRGDATNSNIWKRQKLHVLECQVSFRESESCATHHHHRRILHLGLSYHNQLVTNPPKNKPHSLYPSQG